MTQQTIITTPTNSGEGTPLANAFNICNSNFNELYARAQVSPPATLIGSVGDTAGMYAYSSAYFYYCFANYDGVNTIWAQVTQVADISIAAITDGSSNVKLVGLNGDATININGTSNIAAFRSTGAYVTGIVSATGNIKGANINGVNIVGDQVTGNNVSAVGNVVAFNAFLSGAITTGTGFSTTSQFDPLVFTDGVVMDYDSANSKARFSTGVGDSISFYNNGVGNTEIITFDPAGNIFADGGVSAAGNITTGGVLSAVGNIVTTGYFVGTFVGNVTGNFVVPGANTQVLFNTSGNADAVSGFTYNKDSNTMIVLGVVSARGNVIAGNVTTGGQISATGSITGGTINTAGNVSATGNIIGVNVLTVGTMSSTGNAIHGNIQTGGLISAVANVIGGNLTTDGQISATGNIKTSSYLFVTEDINVSGNITATDYTGSSSSLSGNIIGANIFSNGAVSAVGNILTTGNITGNYVLGNIAFANGLPPTNTIQNGNSNVLISSSAGNISINVNGIAPLALFTPLGQTTTGVISATGTVTAGNIVTGGTVSATGNITGANISLPANSKIASSNASIAFNSDGEVILNPGFVTSSGSLDFYTASPTNYSELWLFDNGNAVISTAGETYNWIFDTTGNLRAPGAITVGNIVNANGNGIGNIGSSAGYFNTVFAKATSAQYADLAEIYSADADYKAGTVVVFGGDKEITVTAEFANVAVAGAISTDPAYLMNSSMAGVPVALRGRVPVQVVGPVYKGDLLVTAGANPGYAVSIGKSTEYPLAVFAKSIETNTDEGVKVITAVII